jgi:hypothetical protein
MAKVSSEPNELLIDAAVAEGITSIATVHDSFGCLPSRAERFRQIIREQFVRMYDDTAQRRLFGHLQKIRPPRLAARFISNVAYWARYDVSLPRNELWSWGQSGSRGLE